MQLSRSERSLVNHLVAGTMLDLAPGVGDAEINEAMMRSWDEDHEIRADVIRGIMRGLYLPSVGADPQGLRVRGARIVGRLNLDYVTSDIPLEIVSSYLPGGLTGDRCRIPRLELRRCVVAANGQAEDGTVRLMGAQIAGQLSLRGSTLTYETGSALSADTVTIGGGAFLDGLMASGRASGGAVRLLGAQIAGQLSLSGATLTNETGPALAADMVTIGDNAYLDEGFTGSGQGQNGAVRLPGAQIAGQLSLRGATLTNETGPALLADSATVGGGAYLDKGFTASGHGEDGAVRLPGVQIAGQLCLRGATLTNDTGYALIADMVTIGDNAYLDEGFTASGHGETGTVRLPDAHIKGRLGVGASDRATTWGAGWLVDGMLYTGYPTVGFAAWLRFLRYGTTSYAAQPYQQLASVARSAGHDADARRALMAQRDDQVERGGLTRWAKAWARFTKLTLGYGYQPWRALLFIGGILTIAILVTFLVPGALAVVNTYPPPTGSAQPTVILEPCTIVQTIQIAIDMAIPLVSTSQGSNCQVTSTPGGQLVAWIGVFITLAGWALTALFAAGFTRAIRQS